MRPTCCTGTAPRMGTMGVDGRGGPAVGERGDGETVTLASKSEGRLLDAGRNKVSAIWWNNTCLLAELFRRRGLFCVFFFLWFFFVF